MSTSGNIGKIAAHFGTSKLAISIRAKILKVSVYAA